ncbi:hypothetical protein ES708_02694 [subsurface metagenome]
MSEKSFCLRVFSIQGDRREQIVLSPIEPSLLNGKTPRSIVDPGVVAMVLQGEFQIGLGGIPVPPGVAKQHQGEQGLLALRTDLQGFDVSPAGIPGPSLSNIQLGQSKTGIKVVFLLLEHRFEEDPGPGGLIQSNGDPSLENDQIKIALVVFLGFFQILQCFFVLFEDEKGFRQTNQRSIVGRIFSQGRPIQFDRCRQVRTGLLLPPPLIQGPRIRRFIGSCLGKEHSSRAQSQNDGSKSFHQSFSGSFPQ